MSGALAGRVGRAHGLDGSFYVEAPVPELLEEGAELVVDGREARVARRGGTDERPLIRLSGLDGRGAAQALRGSELRIPEPEEGAATADGEWDVADLIGCEVPGLGRVTGVVPAPSCDLLEVGGEAGVLVPFIADAVRRIDVAGRVIEVDLRFLGAGEDPG